MAKSPDPKRLKSESEIKESRTRQAAQDELINEAMGYGGFGEAPQTFTAPDGTQSWRDPRTGAVFQGAPPPDLKFTYNPWDKTYSVSGPTPTMPEYIEDQPMDALVFDQLGPSAMGGVSANPWAVQAQWDALAGMRDIYAQGGLTDIDRARIAQARAGEDAYLRGQREATMANMNARGMGGSGLELLSNMAAQQASGQNLAMAGLETEAMAQQRRDQALLDASGMATGLRTQQWDEDAAKAEARDQINSMNWEASRQASMTNWATEEARRRRNTAGQNDRAMTRYEEPFARTRERMAALGMAADKNVGYYNADTGRQNANTASAAQAEQERQNTISNIFSPIKWATGGG